MNKIQPLLGESEREREYICVSLYMCILYVSTIFVAHRTVFLSLWLFHIIGTITRKCAHASFYDKHLVLIYSIYVHFHYNRDSKISEQISLLLLECSNFMAYFIRLSIHCSLIHLFVWLVWLLGMSVFRTHKHIYLYNVYDFLQSVRIEKFIINFLTWILFIFVNSFFSVSISSFTVATFGLSETTKLLANINARCTTPPVHPTTISLRRVSNKRIRTPV